MGTPGDPSIKDAWGPPLNTNDVLIDSAINGTSAIDLTGLTAYTLSVANGAPDQAREALLQFINGPVGDCTVTLPNVPRIGFAQNSTTGGFNVILTAGVGTTAALAPDGVWHLYYADGAGNVTVPALSTGSLSYTTLVVTGQAEVGSLIVDGNSVLASLAVSGVANVGGLVSTSGIIGVSANISGNAKVGSLSGTGAAAFGPGSSCTITINPNGHAIVVNPSGSGSPYDCFIGNIPGSTSNFAAWEVNGVVVGSIQPYLGGTAYNTASDERLKIDDGLIGNSGRIIDRLRAHWFRWKSSPDEEAQAGFFAQQVYKIFPGAVSKGRGKLGSKDFVPWQIDHARFMPLVIAELQVLRRRIAQLEQRQD